MAELFAAFEGWAEIHIHDVWERTRLICYYMGNHKAQKPEQLFPLLIDQIRLKEMIEQGRVTFAKIRKQTPEEQELMKKLQRGR